MTPSNTAHLRGPWDAQAHRYPAKCGAPEPKGEEFWLMVDRSHMDANTRAGSRLVLCGECAVMP